MAVFVQAYDWYEVVGLDGNALNISRLSDCHGGASIEREPNSGA